MQHVEGRHGKNRERREQMGPDAGTDVHVVKGPMKRVTCKEIVQAMQMMKPGKAIRPSEISVEMIVASGKIEVESDNGPESSCVE